MGLFNGTDVNNTMSGGAFDDTVVGEGGRDTWGEVRATTPSSSTSSTT